MAEARELQDGSVKWVETCFCATPLAEERPYWEAYFDLLSIKDAHARSRCRHESGEEHWACGSCDCTAKLEQRLAANGKPFRRKVRLKGGHYAPFNRATSARTDGTFFRSLLSGWGASICAKNCVRARFSSVGISVKLLSDSFSNSST